MTVRLATGHQVVVETAFAVTPGDTVDIMIRPEALRLTVSPTEGETAIDVQVANKIFLGEHIEFLLTHPVLGSLQVLVPRQAERALPGVYVGSTVHLVWDQGTGLILRGE